MSATITAKIRTNDQEWAAKYATPGPDHDSATITFPAEIAVPETFAGKPFLGIDLLAVCRKLPRDYGNRYIAIPEMHILSR